VRILAFEASTMRLEDTKVERRWPAPTENASPFTRHALLARYVGTETTRSCVDLGGCVSVPSPDREKSSTNAAGSRGSYFMSPLAIGSRQFEDAVLLAFERD
jgi:hypothetical protein